MGVVKILNKHVEFDMPFEKDFKKGIISAMNEYAKQEKVKLLTNILEGTLVNYEGVSGNVYRELKKLKN